MRRLNSNTNLLRDEDGATLVMVAISLVMLLGFTAIVIDVGNLMWERRSLQNSADAAALAVAEDCVKEECGDYRTTAEDFADANNFRGAHIAEEDGIDPSPLAPEDGEVTVTTQTGDTEASGTLSTYFASVINHDETRTGAAATARWGKIGGAPTLPITFSYCEWENMVDDPDDPELPTDIETLEFLTPTGADCKGPAGHYAPAGWGWLDTNGDGTCTADVIQGEVDGQQSQGVPSFQDGCTEAFFESLIGETVLMPIFEKVEGGGDDTVYTIAGFAAVVIDAYNLHPGGDWQVDPPCSPSEGGGGGNQGGGNQGGGPVQTCISGKFVEYIEYDNHVDYGGGPDFGTAFISLTE